MHDKAFQSRLHAWRLLLDRTPGEKFALYHSDRVEFASALCGAWLAKKVIYLPNNQLFNTITSLEKSVDGYLGELGLMPEHEVSEHHYHVADFFNQDYQGLVIYTSGSTGEPKAVYKYLSQLKKEIETLEDLFGKNIGTDVEIISTVSHEHLYGLLFTILWPLVTGRIFNTQAHECILISGPAHLKRFPENFITKPVRAIFSSGGALSFETAKTLQQLLGKIPIEIYGSTETGGIAWRQQQEEGDAKWTPMPGVKWRVAENKVLEISSPHLPDDHWFLTSDCVEVSDDNHFLLKSRADRIVKLEGTRISLDVIERSFLQSPLITDVKVLMLDEHHKRQCIAAFIILSPNGKEYLLKFGKNKLNQQLRGCLMNAVEPIAWPRVWRYLDEFPVNKHGKVTQAELKARLPFVFEINIPEDLIYFKGHFPGTPILPGVVQVDWAIKYGRQCFHLPLSFRAIQKLKFQKVIQPNMKINLELCYETKKSLLNFRFYSVAGQHSSGSILFGL